MEQDRTLRLKPLMHKGFNSSALELLLKPISYTI